MLPDSEAFPAAPIAFALSEPDESAVMMTGFGVPSEFVNEMAAPSKMAFVSEAVPSSDSFPPYLFSATEAPIAPPICAPELPVLESANATANPPESAVRVDESSLVMETNESELLTMVMG